MNKTLTTIAIILSLAGIMGCDRVETVAGAQLRARMEQGRGASAPVWYYTGSSDRYDFYTMSAPGGEKRYRVQLGGVPLNQRFPLTSDRSKWIVMSQASRQ